MKAGEQRDGAGELYAWQSLTKDKSLVRPKKILVGTSMVEKNVTQANSTGLWCIRKESDLSNNIIEMNKFRLRIWCVCMSVNFVLGKLAFDCLRN